jgi:chromosome partitioning protein
MVYIIAVANEKGGVAKTTTVLSLGGALVEQNQEVLLIDMDAQSNLTLALGINPSYVRRSITDVLLNTATPISASLETLVAGLDLIPANAEMELAERFLPVRNNYQIMLKAAINGLAVYDFIILDCPPSLGAVTTNALTAADLLVIPTQAEYFSVHALKSTILKGRRVRKQYNPDLRYKILITMLDQRNRIHRSMSEQLRAAFNGFMFETVIGIDTKLRESAVAGLPITHYNSNHRSAYQYRTLAQEIMQYVHETAAQPA